MPVFLALLCGSMEGAISSVLIQVIYLVLRLSFCMIAFTGTNVI